MKPTAKSRWLRVAQRASEFRRLLGSGVLAEAHTRRDAAHADLTASRHLGQQAQADWRARLAQASFHAADDAQFRRFQAALQHTEQRHDEVAAAADGALEDARAEARRLLAEKNALHGAAARLDARAKVQAAQREQRETDEHWPLAPRGDEA